MILPKTPEQIQADARAAAQREIEAKDPLAGREIAVCMAVHNYVTSQLKAPSTADFPGCGWHSSQTRYVGHGLYKVSSYVDSQNSFGAMLRTNFYCEFEVSQGADGALASKIADFEMY